MKDRSSTTQKYDQKSKLGDVYEEKDRISSLSDAILSHILSFMPIKCAARTSLLSTRWKSIWTSVPTINLKQLYFRNNEDLSSGFMDFVNMVLLL
ncbi:F-box/LRR-repeat protein [Camellia lanceoleosa]|uniref:F-box/LRR-repeat protein n=1 Tax=Camellia lanceoleosa TaxID=1840588 RepID=A0ACC0GY00_9ERIC|nr:F-box/LRR-repeat protein [Camellia lanceoleosa]